MKKSIVLALTVALALLAAGCVTSPAPTPTPAPTQAPAPTPAPTVAPTSTPMATTPDNVVVTLPPGTPTGTVTMIHYINGTIKFNSQPSGNYHVLVTTDKGNQYGSETNANGDFSVKFVDDGSATYTIQLADSGNNLVYHDSAPRYLNHTGPLSINVQVQTPGQMNVSVT